MDIPDDKIIKRQDALPTWQLGGSTYHIEFTCRPFTLTDAEKVATRDAVRRGDGDFFDLIVGCIMPDHAHLIIRPIEKSKNVFYDLARIMKGIKGTSAREINRLRG